ncbi:MAG: FAD-binding protein [Acidimicrobiales bacterium]
MAVRITMMRIAVLVKQVPKAELMGLGSDGRLQRGKAPSEMNPWCRRALATGVRLARQSGGLGRGSNGITGGGGYCMAFTMGPPAAGAVSRESIAYGADEAVLVTDPRLAGSDTLVTARALGRALDGYAPFDLILAGKASTDSDTGQVAPELAQLLDLPFLPAAREIVLQDGKIWAKCETDDGWLEATATLPAVVACAERLSSPAKVFETERLDTVDTSLIHVVDADRLGPGPWGQEGSPTVVGKVRVVEVHRKCVVLESAPEEQAAAVVRILKDEGVLDVVAASRNGDRYRDDGMGYVGRLDGDIAGGGIVAENGVSVGVLFEPGRDYVNTELFRAAQEIAGELENAGVIALSGSRPSWVVEQAAYAAQKATVLPGGAVEPGKAVSQRGILQPGGTSGPENVRSVGVSGQVGTVGGAGTLAGTGRLVVVDGAEAPEDMAAAVIAWLAGNPVKVLLAPSTTYGREVASRIGASTSSGIAGDAVGLVVRGGGVVAMKPVFGGSQLAEIEISSPMQVVTIRPGSLDGWSGRGRVSIDLAGEEGEGLHGARGQETPGDSRVTHSATHSVRPRYLMAVHHIATAPRQRVIIHRQEREVDIRAVLSSNVLMCVGAGVDPSYYSVLDPLERVLGAKRVATRKVTDKGNLSKALQVGITGINVSPALYLAIGVQGKANHMVGVRGAGMIVSMNIDPDAAIFAQSDVGMVGDWLELVPALHGALSAEKARAYLGVSTDE